MMRYNLCNAQATFQRLMNVVMTGLDLLVCLVYVDNIIVHLVDLPTHLARLRLLFDRLLAT